MARQPGAPRISVVIPTFNRAPLLRTSLQSLVEQTLPPEDYEIVVVNDGSADATAEVCQGVAPLTRLRYFYIKNSGIAAAKNLGVFAAAAPLVLFFDDDDVATSNLLEEHLRAHKEYPDEGVAVLGYTCWAPGMRVTPVMEYVTDVGELLFAYKRLRHGRKLDYTYFWGGRSSCKRSLLVIHGVFHQAFRFIYEDIELGYRLSKVNLSVVFHRLAVSHMVRPVTYEDFCRRCERQGHALHLFSELHSDRAVQQYCAVAGAAERWGREKETLGRDVRRVAELEALLEGAAAAQREALLRELQALYQKTFSAFRLKGIVEAQLGEGAVVLNGMANMAPCSPPPIRGSQ